MTHTAAFDAGDIEAPEPAHSGGWLRETIVHASIVTVIVAVGVALHRELRIWHRHRDRDGADCLLGAAPRSCAGAPGAGRRQSQRRHGRTRGGECGAAPDDGSAPRAGSGADAGSYTLGGRSRSRRFCRDWVHAKSSASDEPTRMYDGPTPGAAKTVPAKAPERAPEAKSPERAPARLRQPSRWRRQSSSQQWRQSRNPN